MVMIMIMIMVVITKVIVILVIIIISLISVRGLLDFATIPPQSLSLSFIYGRRDHVVSNDS